MRFTKFDPISDFFKTSHVDVDPIPDVEIYTVGQSGFKGKRHTKEAKRLLSIKNKGQKRSEITRSNISTGRKGKGTGDPAGSNFKRYAAEHGNPFLGKTHTPEWKKTRSNSLKEFYKTPEGIKIKERISATLKAKNLKPQMQQAQAAIRGTKWWSNGKVNKRSAECPGAGFTLGRMKNG